jgi:hypothetical protein
MFGGYVSRAAVNGINDSGFYSKFERLIDVLWTFDEKALFANLDELTVALEATARGGSEFFDAKEARALLKSFASIARNLDRLTLAIEEMKLDERQDSESLFLDLNPPVFMIALAGRLFVNDREKCHQGLDLAVEAFKMDEDVAVQSALRMCRDLALVTSGATTMVELVEWYDVESIAKAVGSLAGLIDVDEAEMESVVTFILTATDQEIKQLWAKENARESLLVGAMATIGVLLHMPDSRPVVDVFVRAIPFALSGWARTGTLLSTG